MEKIVLVDEEKAPHRKMNYQMYLWPYLAKNKNKPQATKGI